ncbi:Gfo/Idh/MocA family protein [Haladaptatus halobius]|uniref:Gfo/Idh/MocA family protein n=1 Tax=Haladaptatus halobius TaxID=2884875 RepID=UPI001D0BA827|nr:Gfo/Idh/MocA family oxidoreductase [Haladaptatus halobius]
MPSYIKDSHTATHYNKWNSDPDQWRLNQAISGGGALPDLGVYPLNTSRFLLGSDPVRVLGSAISTHEPFSEVDEHIIFQLFFPDDVLATYTASFSVQPNSRLYVLGTEGQLAITAPFGGEVPQHIVIERGELQTEHTGPAVDEVLEEFDYFANHILTDRKPEPDGADGLKDVEIIEKIYESTESKCWEPL